MLDAMAQHDLGKNALIMGWQKLVGSPRKAFWGVGLGRLFPVSKVKLDAEFEMIRMHSMP